MDDDFVSASKSEKSIIQVIPYIPPPPPFIV